MPGAGRAFDTAQPATGENGGPPVKREAGAGLRSPDVIIDNQAALRAGDAGTGWQANGGSTGVFIDGLPALRLGDATRHGTTPGEIVQGSHDVIIGDRKPGAPKERPHDTSVALHVTDALRRPIHGVAVSALCPHEHRPAATVDGSTSMGGLCRGATVTVHKALQAGTWDDSASRGAHPQATTHQAAKAAKAASAGGNTLAGTGGTAAPGDLSGPGSPPAVVPVVHHAPAPSGTSSGGASVHLTKPAGPTQVVLPTTHNWVELVYEAFGQHLPTGAKDVALLGVRGASLAPAVPTAKTPEGSLEAEAAAGELARVDFTTPAHVGTAYRDLLFCVWTDTSVHHEQHVDVFECTIDASPGKGALHLPFLLEGKLFHAEPGPFDKAHPGSDVALHVFEGTHEPAPPEQASPASVIALAMTQRGTTEWPPGSNLVKYGAWYGDDAQPWCAMFVSWCFAHVGMPLIHYSYCPYGIDDFKSGSFGTWLDGYGADAEPGDIVFYQFNGPGTDSDHTGIVVKNDGSYITTLEGNTTPPGGTGSQSNGGGVYLKTREKNDLIAGFGRPRYPKPEVVPTSFVRWGSEAETVGGTSKDGSTLLHHHYFRTEHGRQVPDPAATRYRRFMEIYNQAKNKKVIPYLIVSSRYVETYADWVSWLADHPTEKPGPGSVIRSSGLVSPEGYHGHYLPSFMSLGYADAVLKHAHEMHDHKAAASLRDALLGSLMKVSR